LFLCLVACGEGAPSADSGPSLDAAVPSSDAAFDAADDSAARDGGPPSPSYCEGAPVECSTRGPTDCTGVRGCRLTQCVGFAIACDARSETDCASELGCRWTGSGCAGEATPCWNLEDARCATQAGCTPSASAVCRGRPTACEDIPRDECTDQPGCDLSVCAPGDGIAEIDLRVVLGPAPLSPGADARVRVEAPCDGTVIEASADAEGRAHLSLARGKGRWNVTVAKVGYGAVSILAITDFEFDGEDPRHTRGRR
jgi:hypothetical protein